MQASQNFTTHVDVQIEQGKSGMDALDGLSLISSCLECFYICPFLTLVADIDKNMV
jgi:hypothetical protein